MAAGRCVFTRLFTFSILCLYVSLVLSRFDSNGYVLYCPCMGRFGNQADHFLGALSFAKEINRTLALPPWRTYKNIPFDEFFLVAPIQQYHRVVLMEDFMSFIAPTVWPAGKRVGYCWLPPGSSTKCQMKDGNPFRPFWDELGVDFDDYEVFHLSYHTRDAYVRHQWKQQFPPSLHPVLAFRGAPATFPVLELDRQLHQYLQWSPKITQQVEEYISKSLPKGKFVGIHLRNGIDWQNACEHVDGISSFMASPQCLGYSHYRTVTKTICLPSPDDIINQTLTAVNQIHAKAVYVATDNNPMLQELRAALTKNVIVVHQNPWLPQLDLAILARADHFIGNCVSSFSAFVKRERDVNGRTTTFFGFTGNG
ncbi:predicted protein [Nematostella vectensis]|uniref:GDP-fucose protein O-fucosyltransferase 1 n=1 Tax=Nematostella vectensis TaxID=45351 RepID=A7S8P6_NEMVE|nr:GDP-fucose protein O-fucosyltransferase 1 [Nematostella vectensis]EDO39909.1 predicted protein [Nematostella vectensis]|eukprot:XP_001631972.1 predicted protein [Nematostella vectensis]